MGSAYDAAIEAGSTPAEAFAAGKAAAEGAATEMGIDPTAGTFLDTMTSVQATFTDAVATGADPAAAMAGAQGMMGAGPALIGDPALIAAAPAFAEPFEQGFAGGMPDGFVAPTMAIGVDGTLVQPPTMGDAMMLGPGGVPMVNPAMMQPGAMECGPDGTYSAADPGFFPPPPFGDPSFVAPTEGMPGFEAFSSLATQIGLDPAAAAAPGFVPPPGTPGMDQPGMPSAQVFDAASGGFAPPEFGLPDPNPEGFTIPTPPPGDFFTAPPADFFDPGALPPVGGTELGLGSFAGPGAPLVPGPDGNLVQDPSFVPPDPFGTAPVEGFIDPGANFVGIPPTDAAAPNPALDTVFATPDAPAPTFDPIADAVGGAIDTGVTQGASPAPDPVAAPIAPDPGPAAPDPVADAPPPPPDDPVAG
jgi:hypothetical protein